MLPLDMPEYISHESTRWISSADLHILFALWFLGEIKPIETYVDLLWEFTIIDENGELSQASHEFHVFLNCHLSLLNRSEHSTEPRQKKVHTAAGDAEDGIIDR